MELMDMLDTVVLAMLVMDMLDTPMPMVLILMLMVPTPTLDKKEKLKNFHQENTIYYLKAQQDKSCVNVIIKIR